jgi:hypothetical protein
VLAGLAAAALALAPSAHACPAHRGTTLASSRVARVYTVQDDYAAACLRRTGRAHRLRYFDGGYGASCFHICESVSSVLLHGSFVAWIYHSDLTYGDPSVDQHAVSVEVYRVTSGRQVAVYATRTTLLLLDRHGRTVTLEPGGALTLHHPGGFAQVLDTGAIADVALAGETLSWTNAGVPRSASIG